MGRLYLDEDAETILRRRLDRLILEGRNSATLSDAVRDLEAAARFGRPAERAAKP